MTNLIVYRTAPNAEHKAALELRQAGIKAYVPRDLNRKRSPFTGKRPAPAPGYVFSASSYRPAFDKHVRNRIGRGTVSQAELARLYVERERKPSAPVRKFADGHRVTIHKGSAEITATISGYRDRMYTVHFEFMGKTQRQTIHEMHVKPGRVDE